MRRRGFSFTELLIIIAIVVLFIAVLLPALARARMAPHRQESIIRVYAGMPVFPGSLGNTDSLARPSN